MPAIYKCFWFVLMWVAWIVGANAQVYTNTHVHTHSSKHISQLALSILHQKKLKYYNLQSICILTVLLHHHLAGNLVLTNCQDMMNYVEIVLYIQFSISVGAKFKFGNASTQKPSHQMKGNLVGESYIY